MKPIQTVFFGLLSVFFATQTLADRLDDFYTRTLPAVDAFMKRLAPEGTPEPWDNLGVRSLIDHAYILALANVDLPEERQPSLEPVVLLFALAEEMQDKDPESRTFGNFRWYWRTPEVTDRNAVEFVASHALPIWFEARDKLPPEARAALARMLHRSVDGCIKHRVRSDYTNIALYNIVHLILLGQIFDRPDAVREGENRLQALLLAVWDHGIFEYNSPTYYAVNVDALQLGLRYVRSESTKKTFRCLLDWLWTDMALNWYKPGLRQSGAQSRTYNYLHGVADSTRLFDLAGLAPRDPAARNVTWLNSLHGLYQPTKEILALSDRYPRLVTQRWGAGPGQWRTSWIQEDIVLGIAAAPYRYARQNMVLTVDLADFDERPGKPPKPLPRCYFIADGREDPYGVKRYPTSTAGHQKALHMEAFWIAAQRNGDALGAVMYTPESFVDPMLTGVRSHFVFRKTDAIFLDGISIELGKEPIAVENKPVVLRYGNRAVGIRILWTRHRNGQSPSAYLVDDGNEYGVNRLTVDHWPQGEPVSPDGVTTLPGAAFFIRVAQKIDSKHDFQAWCDTFAAVKIEESVVGDDSLDFRIAGSDGPVEIHARDLRLPRYTVETLPGGPNGTLECDGNELGRPLLQEIPLVDRYARKLAALKPIAVSAEPVSWEAEDGVGFYRELVEPDDAASGGFCVRVNGDFSWDFDVKQAGRYYLWARVHAEDPQHDSFFAYWNEKSPSKNPVPQGGAWHLGSGKDWRWIPLTLDNGKKPAPLEWTSGIWRLTLQPREQDARVDRFFLTTDPDEKPQQ